MIRKLQQLILDTILDPYPLRTITKKIIQKFEIGSYKQRLKIEALERSHYAHCIYNAAVLAKKLGYRRMSVLEYGVAAGNGLLNIEYHAQETSKLLSIDIDIYGFDTGEGPIYCTLS